MTTPSPNPAAQGITLLEFSRMIKTWIDHQSERNWHPLSKSSALRTVCSCFTCDMVRRVAIDDNVMYPRTKNIRRFYATGGTVEELSRFLDEEADGN